MFSFTIRYFGFLKHLPGLPHFFDVWLKLYTFITKPAVLDWVDRIELEVIKWDGVKTTIHKYGGIQFNCQQREIGHIHGNGLLDLLLNLELKQQLLKDGRIQNHHYLKNTGWISFWICTEDDQRYAVQLLRLGYERLLKT
jgi:hypothetical protein